MNLKSISCVLAVSFSCCLTDGFADGCLQRNPPGSTEGETKSPCGCSGNGGDDAEVSDDCIKVMLGMGSSTPWTGSQPLALKVFADDSSPMVFTPDSLYPIMGYTFKRLGNAVLSDGVTAAEVVFSHPNGEPVHFVFKEGESLGRPDPGVHVPMDERLQMVDAQGWATDHDPVYWDLYETEGSVRRFLASDLTGRRGSLVSVTDSRGLVTIPGDMGVDLVYGPDGVRQFLTPSRLADVRVVRDGYDVAIYPLQSAPAKDPATGLYPVPDVPTHRFLSVRSANGGKQAVVTLKTGESDPKRYVFDYVSGDWSLTRPNGVREIKDRVTDDSSKARLSKEVRSSDNTLISKSVMNYKWESWGYAMTNKVEGFGGVTQTTSWTYYTSGGGTGKVKTSLSPTGLLTEYAYDDEGREQSIRRSSPDMMTELTTYSYVSVDPSDVAPPVDTRPRTVVKTLDGIECERTYYIYSPLTNIVERVGTQGAPYGSTNALRTVTAFYPTEVGAAGSAARVGRVASIRHEDGRLDLYDYALTDGIWAETVTHLHEQSPEPVSGKTTRDTTLTNRRGETVERKTEAFIDGSWYTIARDRMTYNTTGKRIRTENLAGQATVTDWDCCHKVSETQPDGSTTTWDYDDEGRVIASSRLIPLDMSNVTWLTTCYEYDALGRQTATWQTNFAAHVGLPVTRTRYDALGRVIARIDQLGNTTTTEYNPDGRAVFVRNPNTSTRVTTRSANGDVLSITGTAVTPEFHSYGILPDGTRWSRTVRGETANSPRFTKRYENLLGQTIREERSGFRGAVLATTHTYDSLGRLVFTSADYEPCTEYTYDVLGNRVATTKTVGGDDPGAPQPADTQWRKSESLSHIAIIDGDVWLTQTNIVSCSDASIAPLVSSSARQLTGLTAALPARSHTTDIRSNVTVNEMLVDSSVVTSRQNVPYATNKPLSISRYGASLMEVSVSAVINTIAYDSLGRQIAHTDGRGNTRHTEYNSFGQRVASIDALGNRITYTYDQFGNLASVTDPLGNATVYEYNLRGNKVLEYGATYPVRYTYDIFGNKTSMTTFREGFVPDASASGDTTTWFYDIASGSMTNKVYADGKGPTYSYTPNAKLSQRTWARGIVTDYSYDNWGSLTNTVYSDTTPTVSLAYDALGRQAEARDAAGATTFLYDSFGSLTNETVIGVAGTNTIERFCDAFGRDAGYALNGVRQSILAYDAATGRLASMQIPAIEDEQNHCPPPPLFSTFQWTYLPGSDLKQSLTYPNGLTASWTYDANNQLLQVCNAFPTNVISQYDYTYDAAGHRVQIGRSGSAMSENRTDVYGYNLRGELTNAVKNATFTEYAYQYDDIGNRITSLDLGTNRTYTANNLNQYTLVGRGDLTAPEEEFTPHFDLDGNQTLIKTATGTWSVTYNGENRPILWTCTQSDNSSITTNQIISMSFDRMGRRVTKNNQRFVYTGYLSIANLEYQTSNIKHQTFIWDPTEPVATRPLVWNSSTFQPFSFSTSYYTHDGNKNVSDVVASGDALVAHYEYEPFGAVFVLRGGSAASNPWRFSSEFAEDETATVYYNYRHYNPISKWLTREPLRHFLPNLYCICDNDSLLKYDHKGLLSKGDSYNVSSGWWIFGEKCLTIKVVKYDKFIGLRPDAEEGTSRQYGAEIELDVIFENICSCCPSKRINWRSTVIKDTAPRQPPTPHLDHPTLPDGSRQQYYYSEDNMQFHDIPVNTKGEIEETENRKIEVVFETCLICVGENPKTLKCLTWGFSLMLKEDGDVDITLR